MRIVYVEQTKSFFQFIIRLFSKSEKQSKAELTEQPVKKEEPAKPIVTNTPAPSGQAIDKEKKKELQKARFIFVPNVSDASPRVLTEALCYDLRLLVNYNLLGGWKYVNEQTGVLFNDVNFQASSFFEGKP